MTTQPEAFNPQPTPYCGLGGRRDTHPICKSQNSADHSSVWDWGEGLSRFSQLEGAWLPCGGPAWGPEICRPADRNDRSHTRWQHDGSLPFHSALLPLGKVMALQRAFGQRYSSVVLAVHQRYSSATCNCCLIIHCQLLPLSVSPSCCLTISCCLTVPPPLSHSNC